MDPGYDLIREDNPSQEVIPIARRRSRRLMGLGVEYSKLHDRVYSLRCYRRRKRKILSRPIHPQVEQWVDDMNTNHDNDENKENEPPWYSKGDLIYVCSEEDEDTGPVCGTCCRSNVATISVDEAIKQVGTVQWNPDDVKHARSLQADVISYSHDEEEDKKEKIDVETFISEKDCVVQ
jgi:hypothetical protein